MDRASWLRFPAEDRDAILQLIRDHEAATKKRQGEYRAQHQDRDPVLVNAFKRRRAACKLALELLGEDPDNPEPNEQR